jgi:hypothetical protein
MTEPRPRAPLAFVDTETTGLDPNRHEVWEVFLHLREFREDGTPRTPFEKRWFLPVDLGKADPVALTIGRYYERWTKPTAPSTKGVVYVDSDASTLEAFAAEFARLTHGAHLVAAVPSFDDAFLKRLLTKHGACPGWHYHLVDVEALAIGYLRGIARGVAVAGDVARFGATVDRARQVSAPPWDSSALTQALGISIDESTKHTAEGDVRWAIEIYDKVMSATGLDAVPPSMAAEAKGYSNLIGVADAAESVLRSDS